MRLAIGFFLVVAREKKVKKPRVALAGEVLGASRIKGRGLT